MVKFLQRYPLSLLWKAFNQTDKQNHINVEVDIWNYIELWLFLFFGTEALKDAFLKKSVGHKVIDLWNAVTYLILYHLPITSVQKELVGIKNYHFSSIACNDLKTFPKIDSKILFWNCRVIGLWNWEESMEKWMYL